MDGLFTAVTVTWSVIFVITAGVEVACIVMQLIEDLRFEHRIRKKKRNWIRGYSCVLRTQEAQERELRDHVRGLRGGAAGAVRGGRGATSFVTGCAGDTFP